MATQGKMSLSAKNNNPLIPRTKILSTLEEQDRYLDILMNEANGFLSVACKEFGCSTKTVLRRMEDDRNFNEAITKIKEAYRIKRLDTLEQVSFQQAQKASSVRERIFQLEALHPARYRSTHRDFGPANIQIVLGVDVPLRRFGMNSPNPPEIDQENVLDAEVVSGKDPPESGLESMDFEL